MNFLDYSGLQRFLERLKAIIPTKTSDIQNDSGYLTQHNPVDSSLSETSENAVQNKVVKGALDGKSDTGHTHSASDVSGLSTVATSGSYNDLSNTPTIPTVNNKTLTIQKNGTTVKTFTANSASDVTANITVPTAVSELTNDSGYLTSASSLDSSKLTGTIDIARLPKGALERLVTVADQTARFALTTSDVQLGDTVKQLDTGVMYIVTDETKLNSADGYTEYTAGSATSVPWSGVTGKPSSFTPSSHTHGNVTNDGKLPTASRALISDSSKNITVSSVSDTELGYLSGVTSSVQTQLNAKAADSEVVHKTGNEDISGTKTFSAIIKNKLNNAEIAVIPSSTLSTAFRVCDKNDAITANLQYNQYTTGNSDLQLNLRTKGSNNNNISRSVILNTDQYGTWFYFRPSDDSAIALGSASYKWKSVYADVYYLGTTAFGDIATHNASEFSASNHVHGNISNDGKVGTTANKPLITGTGGVVQAGSFGNAANTFCEGNDSRLSDARTPVAHTHTKSDVTDLFNSANVWTGDNTYSKTVAIERSTDTGNFLALKNTVAELGSTPASATPVTIAYRDKNNDNLGYMGVYYDTDGSNHFRLYVRNKYTSGVPSTSGSPDYAFFGLRLNADKSKEGILRASFRPYDNNTYNLGSLTYRWGTVYSCGNNVRSGNIDFTDTTTTGMKEFWHFSNVEKNGSAFFHIGSQRNHSLGLNEEHFRIKNVNDKWADLYIQLDDNNQFTIGTTTHSDVTNNGFRGKFTPLGSFIPYANNSYDLGSSSYQWNNLYAKNYFYNGTQWGLDQANTWTAQNSFNSDLNLNYASTDVDDIVNSVAGSATLDNFVHMTGNETVNGIKSFPDGVIANVTGNVTGTAAEFSTNKSITLTGLIEGTASSKGGWTIPTSFRYGYGGRSGSTTEEFIKLASGTVSGPWNVYNAIFLCNADERFETCLLQLGIFVNQAGNIDSPTSVRLFVKSLVGLHIGRLSLGYKNNSGSVSFEIYAYNYTNQGIRLQLLSEFIRRNSEAERTINLHTNVNISSVPSEGFTLVNAEPATIRNDFSPFSDNAYNLGTSTFRWKSFNGVNPGALSLPDTLGISGTENVNYFNVIGYLNNTGTPATIPSTATYDGWLYINAKDGAGSYITVDDNPSSFGTSVYGNNGLGSQSVGLLCLICPIRAGHSYSVRIKSDGIVNARIYPAQGNV